tara:strand:+ start:253 stop:429 length:177 start_codon:yes stop_codon:yes gene_type:complete
MSINWGTVLVILVTLFLWYAIFKIGFWHTLFWIVLGSVLGGLTTKFWERKNDYTKYIG